MPGSAVKKQIFGYIQLAGVLLMAFLMITVYGQGLQIEAYKTKVELLADSIERSNNEARLKLERLTKERDEKQAKLDKQHAEQEIKDETAKSEIDRLSGELERRPFRVRYITTTGGSCGVPDSNSTTTTEAGAGDSGTAYGLLPESNSRRLRGAIEEIETLSAAYRSCRSTLLNQQR